MVRINDNFGKLPVSYLFSEVGRRVAEYKRNNPNKEVIRMDIGDVTKPIFPCVALAMHEAVVELSSAKTFHGYGPEQGYAFLRDAIAYHDYHKRGIDIESSDIFVSDGAKSDLGNLGDIYSRDCKVAVMNPAYPVYVDDSVIDDRGGELVNGKWSNLVYLECDPANGFLPTLPSERADVIYLCFPNNPTGVAINKNELQKWVDYARENGSLIIYDSAYEAFVSEYGIVKSIYEIEGADEVAIEVRSFSKTAGFTGIRCGYTVVPRKLKGINSKGETIALNSLWNRRQTTKFNGASYVSQRGAAAIYTEEGQRCVNDAIGYYLGNAQIIKSYMQDAGYKVFGAENSPYVWASLDNGISSWELFDEILNRHGISTTPGSGFGSAGEGYIRLTGFNSRENTFTAMKKLVGAFI